MMHRVAFAQVIGDDRLVARSMIVEVLGDGVALDETGEQSLAEQPHHRVGIPGLSRRDRR
jgi:hypothetical protein